MKSFDLMKNVVSFRIFKILQYIAHAVYKYVFTIID